MSKVIWQGKFKHGNQVRVVDAEGWLFAERARSITDAMGETRWKRVPDAFAAEIIAIGVYYALRDQTGQ